MVNLIPCVYEKLGAWDSICSYAGECDCQKLGAHALTCHRPIFTERECTYCGTSVPNSGDGRCPTCGET